jgi:hypothetical protein
MGNDGQSREHNYYKWSNGSNVVDGTACKCHSTLFSLAPHSLSHPWFVVVGDVECVLPIHLVEWLSRNLQVLVDGYYEG